MKSEDTPFEGGPMDGRVLPVLLGLTGHPPKTYRIPVPDPHGGAPTVLIYRRVSRGKGRLTHRWKYVHDPAGDQGGDRLRWPWRRPDATPGGKPDDADG
ncbi:hypothetical protein [Streptomyces sp. TRM70350]|uniref:hypothetical protein n=1 Tax=Streptomyces sp. TRM70350 TaxID=2856165 RepID=UPI001C462D5D|nr:hypothetical protein [Streptomyces sp. TRM70350]MBV7697265.1 hypothetical protein [Streptomyces sp. TRM70350]